MFNQDSEIKLTSIRKFTKSSKLGLELKDSPEVALRSLKFITSHLQIPAKKIRIVIPTKLL